MMIRGKHYSEIQPKFGTIPILINLEEPYTCLSFVKWGLKAKLLLCLFFCLFVCFCTFFAQNVYGGNFVHSNKFAFRKSAAFYSLSLLKC